MADQDIQDALAFQSALLSETIQMASYCAFALRQAGSLPPDEAALIASCMKRIAEKIDLASGERLPGQLAPLLSSLARCISEE